MDVKMCVLVVLIYTFCVQTCLALREPMCPRRETEILQKIEELKSDVRTTTAEVDKIKEKLLGRNGLMSGIPVPYLTPPLQVAEIEREGWQMIFRASAGNSLNVYDAWTAGTGTSDTKPTSMARSYTSHFRDPGIDSWQVHNFKYVKFALYKEDREVVYIIFDANGSTNSDWFSKERVLASSWPDMTPNAQFNYFSIAGIHETRPISRRFYINKLFNSCPGDIGYVAVVETTGPCEWDKHVSYPQFLYSDINSADVWQRWQFGRADFMAVLVHM